ncbi:MAG: toprim domain-containing protein, partial [Maritimibacter sp.]|nr:toprim domain-containing protein [Maritimibacter sp.]
RAERAAREKRAGRALQLWLSAREGLRGTPVAAYLADARGIDLGQLGRQPRALRYLERTRYYHMDDRTGEVFERDYPALATLVVGPRGKPAALHRTYLAPHPVTGRWDKAAAPADWPFDPDAWNAKKVYGDYAGCWIVISNGAGARGGRGLSLWKADPGQHVYVTEGIEDALSVAILLPEARVIAAVSLSNIGNLRLPGSVARVTLVADLDENDQARAQLERAIAAHQRAGREVRLWQNAHGGKDLNDALRAALESRRQEQEGAA